MSQTPALTAPEVNVAIEWFCCGVVDTVGSGDKRTSGSLLCHCTNTRSVIAREQAISGDRSSGCFGVSLGP